MLHDFIEANRAEIEARAARRAGDYGATSGRTERDRGIPLFLAQLMTVLSGQPPTTPTARDVLATSATSNGEVQLREGCSVEQVVHAYGDVCQAVTELATEKGVRISTADFKTFNSCLDDATAHAVTEYVDQRERSAARVRGPGLHRRRGWLRRAAPRQAGGALRAVLTESHRSEWPRPRPLHLPTRRRGERRRDRRARPSGSRVRVHARSPGGA
jgi:hypothetical protein